MPRALSLGGRSPLVGTPTACSGSPALRSRAPATADGVAVLFFFAGEKLLFRCPAENPFTFDIEQPQQQQPQQQQQQQQQSGRLAASSSASPPPGASSSATATQVPSRRQSAAAASTSDPTSGEQDTAAGRQQKKTRGSSNSSSPSSHATRPLSASTAHARAGGSSGAVDEAGAEGNARRPPSVDAHAQAAPQRAALRRPVSSFNVPHLASAAHGEWNSAAGPAAGSGGEGSALATGGATQSAGAAGAVTTRRGRAVKGAGSSSLSVESASTTLCHSDSSSPVALTAGGRRSGALSHPQRVGQGVPHAASTTNLSFSSAASTPAARSRTTAVPTVNGAAASGSNASHSAHGSGASTDRTCVGIPVNALLHLLRVSLTGCTTIHVGGGTLLVFPLTPHSAGSPGAAAPADGASRAATAMLVVAMRQPDRDDGAITRFVQCFVNILCREECRARYVSAQAAIMEELTLCLGGEGGGDQPRANRTGSRRGIRFAVDGAQPPGPGSAAPRLLTRRTGQESTGSRGSSASAGTYDRYRRHNGAAGPAPSVPPFSAHGSAADNAASDEDAVSLTSRDSTTTGATAATAAVAASLATESVSDDGDEDARRGWADEENGQRSSERSASLGDADTEAHRRPRPRTAASRPDSATATATPTGLPRADGTPASGERGSTVHDLVAQDLRASLAREIAALSYCINVWSAQLRRRSEDSLDFPNAGPALPARSREGAGPWTPRLASSNGASVLDDAGGTGPEQDVCALLPAGITINGLAYLPLDALTGVSTVAGRVSERAPSGRQHLSVYGRLNPCGLLRLLDPSFPDTLQQAYGDAVGRRYAKLLPLTAVCGCLSSLAPPWRVGAFYRALERALVDSFRLRQQQSRHSQAAKETAAAAATSTWQQQQQQQSTSATASSVGESYDRERDLAAAATYHYEAGFAFVAVEIIEFLRQREVIAVETEIALWLTHGDIVSAERMESQRKKAARRQHRKQQQQQQQQSSRTTHAPAGRPGTLPSTLVLHMLTVMRSTARGRGFGVSGSNDDADGALMSVPGSRITSASGLLGAYGMTSAATHAAGGASAAQGTQNSPSTANTTSCFPPLPYTEGDADAARHDSRREGAGVAAAHGAARRSSRDNSVSSTTLTVDGTGRRATPSNCSTTAPSPHSGRLPPPRSSSVSRNGDAVPGGSAGASHHATPSAIRTLLVHCAWGSACPLCEELAASQPVWSVPAEHVSLDIPVNLIFPFLDPSVIACAQYLSAWRGHTGAMGGDGAPLAAAGGVGGFNGNVGNDYGSTVLLMSPQSMRPWFLKPEMYMAPAATHNISALQVFHRINCAPTAPDAAVTSRPRDSTDAPGRWPSSGLAECSCSNKSSNKSSNLPATPSERRRVNPYISADDEEGSVLLSTEAVPADARAWLHRFSAVMEGRMDFALRERQRLGRQLAKALVVQVVSDDTARARTNTAFPSSAQDDGPSCPPGTAEAEGPAGAAAVSSSTATTAKTAVADAVVSQVIPVAANSVAASPSSPRPRSLHYTKRLLPDRSAVTPVGSLRSPLHSFDGLHSPLSAAPASAAGATKESASHGSHAKSGPLATPSTRSSAAGPMAAAVPLMGIDRFVPLEALVLFCMHHLVAFTWGRAGVDMEIITRQLERNLRRLRPFLSALPYVTNLRAVGWTSEKATAALARGEECGVSAAVGAGPAAPTSLARDSADRKNANDSSGAGHAVGSAVASADAAGPALCPLDVRLLQTYELYDALSLMPCLSKYSGRMVRVVPTQLLLHTVVNEFNDVFLVGGGAASSLAS